MTLGTDLVLLAVDEARGTVRFAAQLGIALAAAELVDLARTRRIEAVGEGVRVVEELRTGDPILDRTLARLSASPKGTALSSWIAMQAGDRVMAHLAAMIESGELEGRMTRLSLDSPVKPVGLRIVGDRRGQLIEKLTDAVLYDAPIEDEAFAALAQAALIPRSVLAGRTRYRVQKAIKPLLSWFSDTWRFLPGVADELRLGDDDVEDGDVNPVDEEPWRLLIRLAVGEALKSAPAITRRSERANGLSKDVETVLLMSYALEHHL